MPEAPAKPPSTRSERVQVRLPAELVAQLRDYARRRNVGLSTLVRMMLAAQMEQQP